MKLEDVAERLEGLRSRLESESAKIDAAESAVRRELELRTESRRREEE